MKIKKYFYGALLLVKVNVSVSKENGVIDISSAFYSIPSVKYSFKALLKKNVYMSYTS